MSEAKNWYETGYDAVRKDEARKDAMNGPDRFWVKVGTRKNAIFVDDTPFNIYEHNPKIKGEWKNWLTCVRGLAEDVVCCDTLGDRSSYLVGYFTVVEEYTSQKTGQKVYEMRLFGAKSRTLKRLEMEKSDRENQSLACVAMRISRTDKKSPSVGEDFKVVQELDPKKVFDMTSYKGKKLSELWSTAQSAGEKGIERLSKIFQIKLDQNGNLVQEIAPFNYMEILKPKHPKDIKFLLRDYVSGSDEPNDGITDSDVPF